MPCSDTLTILLGVYGIILLVNTALSGTMLYLYREPLYRKLFLLWFWASVNFILQGIFRNFGLPMVLAFCTYYPCTYYLARILSLTTGCRFPFARYHGVMGAAVLWAVGTSLLELGFTARTLLPAAGVAFPMLDSAIRALRGRGPVNAGMARIFCVLLILNALHFLDYPFLRHSDANAVFGFSLALLFLFSFSVFLPQFSIAFISSRYSGMLERSVEEKTQTLQDRNTELRATNAELGITTRENQLLLSVLCHDVANPLTVILTGLSRLHQVPDGAKTTVSRETRKSLDRMGKAATAISEILRSARAFHAIRTGKSVVPLEAVPIVRVVEEAIESYADACQSKKVRFRLDSRIDPGTTVVAERAALKNHVLSNLFSNAIKYSFAGDEILVCLEGEGGHVRLTVADRGIGIPKDIVGQLFELDRATSRTGTNSEPGTGFGMPILKSYLDQFQAAIDIESEPMGEDPSAPHGTSVHVRFRKSA